MEKSSKRHLSDTSPEGTQLHKRRVMPENNDVFSWNVFETKMEKLLENVAKKEDVQELQRNLIEVKKENESLRRDMNQLQSKIESMDKSMRRTNVVVSGIKSTSLADAKSKIIDICANTLNINVNIVRARVLKPNQEYLVEFETVQQAINVLMNGGKLKGGGIFVRKDLTADERSKQYHMRKLKNELIKLDGTTRCKFKGSSLIVNDKQYEWFDGAVIAKCVEDKESLRIMLANSTVTFTIEVMQRQPPRNGQQQSTGPSGSNQA